MSHRGTNSRLGTVQLWDGSKWVAWLDMAFSGVVSSVARTLWSESTGSSLGYTGANNLREQLTHTLDNKSSVTALLSEEKRLVILDAPSEVQISYDLPIAVNSISPQEGVTDGENRLIVEFTISVNRADGSTFSLAKFLGNWRWVSDAAGYAAVGVEALSATAGSFDVDASNDGGAPAAARLLIGQAGASAAVRYFIDMDIKLFKFVPP